MSGTWAEWRWDPTLFAGTAPYYERGRLPYAPGLADAFQTALALDGHGRLLDVGCGPGTIALRLAHVFDEVIGVDPDAGMLREAERLAAERDVRSARWLEARGEDLPAGLRSFRAITFAASFHWMDRPVVAAAVQGMLEGNGAVVHIDSHHHDRLAAGTDHPEPPHHRIDALRRAHLGEDRRAGASIRNTSPDDEDRVFRAAGFEGPEVVLVPDGRTLVRNIDDIVAETFSMSSTTPHLFGDRLGAFEAELRAVLEDASDHGRFAVQLPDNELRIWR